MARVRGSRLAFGAPGSEPRWTYANKDGVGTAYSVSSRLWFTLLDGIVTEVFCPTVDRAQLRDLQFVVADGATFVHEERRHTSTRIEPLAPHARGYHTCRAAGGATMRTSSTWAGAFSRRRRTVFGLPWQTRPFVKLSCGYVGQSDGWTDLEQNFVMDWEFDRAEDGNVALIGEIGDPLEAFTIGPLRVDDGTAARAGLG